MFEKGEATPARGLTVVGVDLLRSVEHHYQVSHRIAISPRVLLPIAALIATIAVAFFLSGEPTPQPVVTRSPPVTRTKAATAQPQTLVTAQQVIVVPQPREDDRPRGRTDFKEVRRAIAAGAHEVDPAALLGPLPVMQPAPPPEQWAPTPVVPQFGVGTPAPAITRGVRTRVPALKQCFDASTSANWSRLGAAFSRQHGMPGPAIGQALLLLEVESDGTTLRIVDAPVETRGSASDGTLNCAQAALRGVTLPVETRGAQRFRVRYALQP